MTPALLDWKWRRSLGRRWYVEAFAHTAFDGWHRSGFRLRLGWFNCQAYRRRVPAFPTDPNPKRGGLVSVGWHGRDSWVHSVGYLGNRRVFAWGCEV